MKSTTYRTLAVGLLAFVTLAATVSVVASSDAATTTKKRASAAGDRCATLRIKAPRGAVVDSLKGISQPGGTVAFPTQPGYPAPPPPVEGVPGYCQVQVVLSHAGADEDELIEVWLPEAGWTGRFQALGGSGYAGGNFGPDLAEAVKSGYAVGTTDAGATPVTGFTSPWALKEDGQVNQVVLENFAERGPHEIAAVGKALVREFYGRSVSYAYWNGCSTGGRQGYMEAQQHPRDFDGILANAPALSWDRFAVASLWPYVVMNQEKDLVSSCKLAAFNTAATKACDGHDGLEDGIISDPLRCDFDPRHLVGKKVVCDGEVQHVTARDARVVRKIWDGPRDGRGRRLWFGLPIGASFDGLATGAPFPVAGSWVQDFIKQNRNFDLASLTYPKYRRVFAASVRRYHDVIASDSPDLRSFRRHGGKLLTWQGLADQLVPVGGTIRYHAAVERSTGRGRSVADFYRLFLAPAAPHCLAGAGPAPTDPLGALVSWVEHGKAPRTLAAATTLPDGSVLKRNVCLYPRVSQYRGSGDPAKASSFRCVSPRGH